jgi:hypothetical protein
MMTNTLDNVLGSLTNIATGKTQHAPRSEAALALESRAMEAIEKDENFMQEELLDASQIITSDSSLANMYLTFKNKALRTSFLLRHMKNIKKDSDAL